MLAQQSYIVGSTKILDIANYNFWTTEKYSKEILFFTTVLKTACAKYLN